MPGGKGKSTGGKAGPKEVAGKTQKSHSAKAGLQVSNLGLDCPCRSKSAVDHDSLYKTRVISKKRKINLTTVRRA